MHSPVLTQVYEPYRLMKITFWSTFPRHINTEPELPSSILQWLCWSSISSSSVPAVFARKTGCANYSFLPGCNPWLLWQDEQWRTAKWCGRSKGEAFLKEVEWAPLSTLWSRTVSLQVGETIQEPGNNRISYST